MSNKKFNANIETIDLLITDLLDDIKANGRSEETDEKLRELIEYRKDLQGSESIRDNTKLNINTLVTTGASIASILLILNFEKADVVTSKAFTLGTKLLGR